MRAISSSELKRLPSGSIHSRGSHETMTPYVEASPSFKARVAGALYCLVFLAGGAALLVPGPLGLLAGLVAGACYVAVTLLFYDLFKPVSGSLSSLAAVISFVGCVNGPLSLLHLAPFHVHSLVFFGVYCVLIGYLVLESTFLPRGLGVLMALAGLGWPTFLSPPLATRLSPYVFVPGILGAGALTLWLLVFGVNEQRWKDQAGVAGASIRSRPT